MQTIPVVPTRRCAARLVKTSEAILMRNGAAGGMEAVRPSMARELLRA